MRSGLRVQPLDMRPGAEAALGRVVTVFGATRPHHAYLFANRRASRMKVLVHDGIGVWLAARRLNSGRFVWPKDAEKTLTLSRSEFDALVLRLALATCWRRRRNHLAVAPCIAACADRFDARRAARSPCKDDRRTAAASLAADHAGLTSASTVKMGSPDAY